jgi:hypothetical protein
MRELGMKEGFAMDRYQEAFNVIRSSQSGKVLLEW